MRHKTLSFLLAVLMSMTTGVASADEHEYVDLGLPSGTLWATCNVGANSPEEYGDYIAWGETEPKSYYGWNTYIYSEGTRTTMTKYCTDSSFGSVDNITELQSSDDAAYINWGECWCVPSFEQMLELTNSNYTTNEWVNLNGVNGLKIISLKNGNYIFLPAAGCRTGEQRNLEGRNGTYWSRMLSNQSYEAHGMGIYGDGVYWRDYTRFWGRTIRPVYIDKERQKFLTQYENLLTVAKTSLKEAQNIQHTDEFIQDVGQLSSPYTEPSEGSLAALIDGNTTTFWHSNWSDGSVAGGLHYLQVDLVNPVDVEVYATFTRRLAFNDHVTNMSIYATNNFDAEKGDCEELLTYACPFKSNSESITSALFDTKGYRYLRFYANTTTTGNGFWHISELQISHDVPAPNAPIYFMTDEAENLRAIIDKQAEMNLRDIDEDKYNTLKNAYDAFMEKWQSLIIQRVDIKDANSYTNDTSTEYNEISYTRNFSNTNWQALYVPFKMSYNDWKEDFEVARINNMNQYDDDEDGNIDRTVMEIIYVKSGQTEANTPYLIKAKTTGEKTITMTNATLYKAEENSHDVSSWNTLFTFTGTYSGVSGADMLSNGYYSMGGGSLHQASTSENSLSPYRWYMAVTDRNGNPKELGEVKIVVFGEEETGLTPTLSQEEGESPLYDLSGRHVAQPRKGLYIRDGKKVVIK